MIRGHGDDGWSYKDIRLNFSSNIYTKFDHSGLKQYLSLHLKDITHYPRPRAIPLEEKIAQNHGLNSQEVIVTAGVTESIYMIARAYSESHSFILSPTFKEYEDACLLSHHRVTIRETLDDIPEYIELLWLCSPNNPTGQCVEKKDLLERIKNHPNILFVLDASYSFYTLQEQITLHEAVKIPNLIVLHSMTKRYGIPGLRLGYMVGNIPLIECVRKYQIPWTVNSLAQEAGLYLEDNKKDYLLPKEELNKEARRVSKILESLGIKVYPTSCHILLCQLREEKALELKEYLAQKHGILIREASNFDFLSKRHFRIAVQGVKEDNILIDAIKLWLKI
ncbi:MAG: aminotransferase class I/II-fold pyridoxal phosphate-dependent enzyme [Prevotella sp.]|nr:aminotransferase class I/II-fold pyridoxal phosphate-dependent enzyme [Prevotella sp.]